MICNKCGKQIADTAKFCTGCGNQIPQQPAAETEVQRIFCTGCGSELKTPNAKFCVQCGTPVNKTDSNTEQTQEKVNEPVNEQTFELTEVSSKETPNGNTVATSEFAPPSDEEPVAITNVMQDTTNNDNVTPTNEDYSNAYNDYQPQNEYNQQYNSDTSNTYTYNMNPEQSAETVKSGSVAKTISCIFSSLLILTGICFMWIGNFFTYNDAGAAMGDVLFEIGYVFDELGNYNSIHTTLFIVFLSVFSVFTIMSCVFIILSVANLINKKANSALTKILLSVIFTLINFGALVAFAVYLMINISYDISIGLIPIIGFASSVLLLVTVILMKTVKKQ